MMLRILSRSKIEKGFVVGLRNRHGLRCVKIPLNTIVRQCSSSNIENNGLFGLQGLKCDDDFHTLVNKSISSIDSIRFYLRANEDLSASQSLALLDSISAELCAVIDVAELCRNVHHSPAFKQSAEEAFEKLSTFLHKLNADDSLHAKLHTVTLGDEWSTLTVEEKLFAENLKQEFESDGIHLTGKLRDIAMQLREEVVSSESTYSLNLNNAGIADPAALTQVGPFDDPNEAHHLASWTAQYVPQPSDRFSADKGTFFTASKDRRIAHALLPNITSQAVRKHLWTDALTHPASNVEPLGRLIKSRQQLAISLGYDSYVHKVLYNKAYETPEQVQELLVDLRDGSRMQALQELAELAQLKGKLNGADVAGNSVVHSNAHGGGGVGGSSVPGFLGKLFGGAEVAGGSSSTGEHVYPWDVPYLLAQHGSSNSGQTHERARAQAQVKQYLSLDACIEGLQLISKELFDIEVEQTDLGPHESWLHCDQSAQLLQKYTVRDAKTGNIRGTVLMDLYERDHKFPGNAHFTVQCGCTRTRLHGHSHDHGPINEDESSYCSIEEKDNGLVHFKQLPIVALVFHFKTPKIHSEGIGYGKHTLLSLTDVETLHHEWGHALHSLLSNTKFQHLSGTRGGTDFVEVPSHWFEYYARTPSVIEKWARHHISGERVPSELLRTALASARMFPAIDLHNQILYSAVDQYMFGTAIGDISSLSPVKVYEKALRGAAEVQEGFTVLPLAPACVNVSSALNNGGRNSGPRSSMNLLDHGHFVNYGGSYYAYLFAKLHAAHIWKTHFEADPLNRDAGRFLNEKLLSYGSSRPPALLLKDLVGDKLDPSHYLSQIFSASNSGK